MRRAQRSFGDGLIAEEVDDLREDWMKYADWILDDETIVAAIYQALGKRHPKSRSRGRRGTPAEVVLRLLILKHVRNWSYEVLEREVRANLVYRDFTRVGGGKMPDAKTMGRWGLAVAPEVIKQVHERLVKIANDQGVVVGRRMRVDTTVVETNIHYPTNSSLLGDGVRVLTRVMKKITKIAGEVGTKLRDRSRSVKLRMLDIARAARAKGPQSQERLKRTYGNLLTSTSRVVGQAKRFAKEVAAGIKRSSEIMAQLVLEGLRQELDEMVPRVQQVRAAVTAQLAVAIAILAVAPVRLANLVAIKLGTNLIKPGGPNSNYWLTFPDYDVKNRVRLEYPLAQYLTRMIDEYIHDFRPTFLRGQNADWLFPGQREGAKSSILFSGQITQRIHQRTGLRMTVHQFRHAAGALILQSRPGEYELVRQLLGHRNVQTTINAYIGLENIHASDIFSKIVMEHMDDDLEAAE